MAELTTLDQTRAQGIALVVNTLATIETWLSAGVTPRQASVRAMQPPPDGFGMARRTANRYVAAALYRLQQDSAQEPLESKRARMVGFLHGQIQRALERRRTLVSNGESFNVDEPDLKAANQAASLLAQIEGLIKPTV